MRPDRRGFTLLEVLIAFAIAALSLALLYRGGVEGLAGATQAARTHEAVSRAQSRLDAACHGGPLFPGIQSGDDGSGFSWRTEVSRADTSIAKPPAEDTSGDGTRVDLVTVRVSIAFGRGRPVSLVTECLSVGAAHRP